MYHYTLQKLIISTAEEGGCKSREMFIPTTSGFWNDLCSLTNWFNSITQQQNQQKTKMKIITMVTCLYKKKNLFNVGCKHYSKNRVVIKRDCVKDLLGTVIHTKNLP